MDLSIQQWYLRYKQQATWTKSIRDELFDRANLHTGSRILDVGCGPGAILEEFNRISKNSIYGLDIDYNSLVFAKGTTAKSNLCAGDALSLPFGDHSFDISLCHFLLLWVSNPSQVLTDMVRVTRPGGFVLSLAEPDYGGRIDYPKPLAKIGDWQLESLLDQGANPLIGRELRHIFTIAGLTNVEVGVLGGQWKNSKFVNDFDLEWEVITSDLRNNQDFQSVVTEMHDLFRKSSEANRRILFVPTFYAIGEVGK